MRGLASLRTEHYDDYPTLRLLRPYSGGNQQGLCGRKPAVESIGYKRSPFLVPQEMAR